MATHAEERQTSLQTMDLAWKSYMHCTCALKSVTGAIVLAIDSREAPMSPQKSILPTGS